MKRSFYFAAIAAFLFGAFALAQEVLPPTSEEWAGLLMKLGTLKGASTVAVVTFVVQALMFLCRTSVGDFLGKNKLRFVMGLTVAATIGAEMLNGGTLLTALQAAPVMAAIQVFLHQIYKQFTEK